MSPSIVSARAAKEFLEAGVVCRRTRVQAAMGCASVGWECGLTRQGTICHKLSVTFGHGMVSCSGGFVGTLGDAACPVSSRACTLGGVVLL